MRDVFPLSARAVRYAWRELIRRAGVEPADETRFRLVYGPGDADAAGPGTVIVVPCDPSAWQELTVPRSAGIDHLPADRVVPDGRPVTLDDRVPVLLWGDGCTGAARPFADRREDGVLVFYADIVAATLFMLSRWEESAGPVRDGHGRFPGRESVAHKQGFLGRPVIDEYALILRAWLRTAIPGWTPARREFRVRLSHDVDHLRRHPDALTAVRRIGHHLVRSRDPLRAAMATGEAIGERITPMKARYYRDLTTLADLSTGFGIGGDTFYFMAAGTGRAAGRRPPDYRPESAVVRRVVDQLRARGFEVGFHPGYETFLDPERLALEKRRFESLLDSSDYGARQHFLRCRFPDTWRHYESVGLRDDATGGYADQEGFRFGTCHPFRPFDLERDREIDVLERPLIVMDGTLRGYRRLSCAEGEARILELARRCRHVEGEFSLLWHNHALSYEWSAWGTVYRRVLRVLAEW